MYYSLYRLLKRIERKTIPFKWIFISIIAIAFIRNIVEHLIKNESMYVANDFMKTFITYFFHFNFFWISIFLGLSILLYLFVRKNKSINQVLNVCLLAFPIILFPPIFDWLIGDKDLMMYPNNPQHIIFDTINFLFFNVKLHGITTGMRIEIFAICLLFGAYIFINTKRWLSSILGFVLSYLFIVFHGIWLSFFAQLYELGFNFTDNFNLATSKLFETGYVLRGSQSKISIVFILLSFSYLTVVFYFRNRKEFMTFINQLRLTRLVHYILLMFFGILIGRRLVLIHFFNDTSFENYFNFSNPFEFIGIIASLLSMVLSFYSAVIFNDISDVRIDRISEPNRPLPSKRFIIRNYSTLGFFLMFFSLAIAYCVNMAFFLNIILVNFVAFLYSNPPFRLKRYLLLSNFSLGFIALFTFFLGASVYLEQFFFEFIPHSLTLTVFFSISVISQIKDVKDYFGDKQFGINNFMTLTNLYTGKIIIASQILIIAFFIPIYFQFYDLLILSLLISVILSILLIRKKFSENTLFYMYFIFSIWFFIRILFSDYLIIK